MEGMSPQLLTHKQCITDNDLVPMSEDANQNCQVRDIETSGNTVSWKITCGGQGGQMDGTGEITYNGDTMEGKMEMTIKGANMKVTNYITGRRIGPCDGQSSSVTSETAPQASPPQTSSKETSKAEETITRDAKDVGKAAKDEAKKNTIDEVRKGVKGFFKKVFE